MHGAKVEDVVIVYCQIFQEVILFQRVRLFCTLEYLAKTDSLLSAGSLGGEKKLGRKDIKNSFFFWSWFDEKFVLLYIVPAFVQIQKWPGWSLWGLVTFFDVNETPMSANFSIPKFSSLWFKVICQILLQNWTDPDLSFPTILHIHVGISAENNLSWKPPDWF